MFILLVKVTGKKNGNFSKCFSEQFEIEGCWKILKLKKMFGSCVTPLVGHHVVKHGLKKMKFEFVSEKKCFPGRGLCLTHVGAPCCE